VFQMAADLGAIGGPLIAGWLTDVASFQVAFLVTAAVLGASVVTALAMRPEKRPASRPTAG
jgi:MFS family permease